MLRAGHATIAFAAFLRGAVVWPQGGLRPPAVRNLAGPALGPASFVMVRPRPPFGPPPASTTSLQTDTPPAQISRYGLRCGPASLAGPFVDSSICRPPSPGGPAFFRLGCSLLSPTIRSAPETKVGRQRGEETMFSGFIKGIYRRRTPGPRRRDRVLCHADKRGRLRCRRHRGGCNRGIRRASVLRFSADGTHAAIGVNPTAAAPLLLYPR
jgi:hypothetical protein